MIAPNGQSGLNAKIMQIDRRTKQGFCFYVGKNNFLFVLKNIEASFIFLTHLFVSLQWWVCLLLYVNDNNKFTMNYILEKLKVVGRWIASHKYLTVTIVFLAIIIVIDDNNMISHIKNNAIISDLNEEIKTMEADSVEIQAKLKLYTDGDLSVIEDVAREQGLIKENEDIFIIK